MEHNKKVGILGIEVYFPRTYVSQKKLEEFDNVSKGKYTVGLGQRNMSFHVGNEDSVSMAMTVLSRLLQNYNIRQDQIGRLDVGTETPVDYSKSIKSYLMQFFQDSGVTDIQGCDHVNACYGGTQAFLDACAWVTSPLWNGKLAIVIAVDDAVYAKGPARPTGGCGAVAIAIGPNAPIVLDTKYLTFYSEHVFDFYKPIQTNQQVVSQFPVVDGKLSLQCYLRALQRCYRNLQGQQGLHYDYFVLHSPFNKMVRKAVGRVWFENTKVEIEKGTSTLDAVINNIDISEEASHNLRWLLVLPSNEQDEALNQGQFDQLLTKVSQPLYEQITHQSQLLTMECGNTYNASLYQGLSSLLYELRSLQKNQIHQKRILMFSYGSGSCSAMIMLQIEAVDDENVSKLGMILNTLNLQNKLEQRIEVEPSEYERILNQRFLGSSGDAEFSSDGLCGGVYYLKRISQLGQRGYGKVE